MLGLSARVRIAGLVAFAALACSDRSAGNDEVADEAADDSHDDDGGAHDDGGNDDDDDGLTSADATPEGDGDDDGPGPMTSGDDDDDATSSDDGGAGPRDPLDGMSDVETLATGFDFAEGPVWVADLGALLFTDIPADAILQLDPSTNAVTEFVQGTGAYVNGLGLDALGNLLMCEGGGRRLTRAALNELRSAPEVLADAWEGQPFNSPNDVAIHASGSIFFTDPTYGTSPELGGSPPVLAFRGVYRIAPDGELTLVDDTLEQPNGVVISPQGDTLYVVDTPSGNVFAYPLDEDGQPGPAELLLQTEGGGDGMTIDADGNLYVASGAGIEVWRPDGSGRWGAIPLPDVPTNCAFGGEDLRVLYVTLPTQLVCVELAVPGLENAS